MKIAAFVGIKDEVELIERTIAHLRLIGVDTIIACDMMSTDGTWEFLNQHRADDLWVFRMDDLAWEDHDDWSRQVLELALKPGADWVLFQDADEYWLPASGSLKSCASFTDCDVLIVDRYNVPLLDNRLLAPDVFAPEGYEELLLVCDPVPNFASYMRAHPDSSWIRGVPNPKVIARPEVFGTLAPGCHDVRSRHGAAIRRGRPDDLLIAHLPFTTYSRFARKVSNIREIFRTYDSQIKGDMSWQWRRWLGLDAQGKTAEEFQRQIFTGELVRQYKGEGVIRSAADVFRMRGAFT